MSDSSLTISGTFASVYPNLDRVSGFKFRISDFGFRISGFGFRVSGFDFRVLGGFWGYGLRLRSRVGARGSGVRVQSSGFRVQGAGFRGQGSGFRVQGLSVRVYVGLHATESESGFGFEGRGMRCRI